MESNNDMMSLNESAEDSSDNSSVTSSSNSSSQSDSQSELSDSKKDSLRMDELEEQEEGLNDLKNQTEYKFPGLTFPEYLEKEKEILESCHENNCLFIDEAFPADLRSLYRVPFQY